MSADDGHGGNDFWSRRKAAVRKAELDHQRRSEDLEISRKQAELAERSDAEVLAELDLPDPDSLTTQDDFSRFLASAVPERLRRKALRRLWGLNPVLANLDGLVDYADDYTDAATVISNLQTVYQVGKGMFDRFAEVPEEQAFAAQDDVDFSATSSKPFNELYENDATQNNDIENEKPSNQLTQRESSGQTVAQRGDRPAVDMLEAMEDEPTIHPARRIRFDYS